MNVRSDKKKATKHTNKKKKQQQQKLELITTPCCGVLAKNGGNFFSPMTDDYVFTCELFIVSAFVFFTGVLVCTYVMLRQARINENESYNPADV